MPAGETFVWYGGKDRADRLEIGQMERSEKTRNVNPLSLPFIPSLEERETTNEIERGKDRPAAR